MKYYSFLQNVSVINSDAFTCPHCGHSIVDHVFEVGLKTEMCILRGCYFSSDLYSTHCNCEYFLDESQDV